MSSNIIAYVYVIATFFRPAKRILGITGVYYPSYYSIVEYYYGLFDGISIGYTTSFVMRRWKNIIELNNEINQ